MTTLRPSLVAAIVVSCVFTCRAQLDTALLHTLSFDTAFYLTKVQKWNDKGFLYFYPNTVQTGELFTTYQTQFFDDTLNEMILWRTDTSFHTGKECRSFQQHYRSIPIEGAEFYEHTANGYCYRAHGKVLPNMEKNTENMISPSAALTELVDTYDTLNFAWLDDSADYFLQQDLGDSTATYLPTGNLVWALDNLDSLDFILPRERYQLTWTFDVMSYDPFQYQRFFVNAVTKNIFRIDNLIDNASATTLHHGNRTIHTTKRLFNTEVLKVQGNDHKIHTKKHKNGTTFGSAQNYKNNGDSWGTGNQNGTTAHWIITMAWDYYKDVHSHHGLNYGGRAVRVLADKPGEAAAQHTYDLDAGYHYFLFAPGFTVLDAGGHEYTHGVIDAKFNHSPPRRGIPGAIHEGFCDIFGYLVEHSIEGSETDWLLGEDGDYVKRSMINPNDYDDPDEVGGTFWNYIGGGDQIHTDNGVFNKFFQLLVDGGTHHGVTVNGVGQETAAKIIYETMMFHFQSGDDYTKLRIGMIDAAEDLQHGFCTNVQNSIRDAWSAVNVGQMSSCPLSIEEIEPNVDRQLIQRIFPNPAQNEVSIDFRYTGNYDLEIRDIHGRLISLERLINSQGTSIDIVDLAEGYYIISVKYDTFVEYNRFIKN